MCSVIGVHFRRDYSKSFGFVGSWEGFRQVGSSGMIRILCCGILFVTGMCTFSDYVVSFQSVGPRGGFQKVGCPGIVRGRCCCFCVSDYTVPCTGVGSCE